MYRTIDAAFWTDPEVRKLAPPSKLLFMYLITNPHTHVSGIYILPREVMMIETGYPKKTVDTLCDTLSSPGFCAFDVPRSVVWVRNMFEYQGSGEKNSRSAAYHLVEDLHKSQLIIDFCARYPRVREFLPAGFLDTVSIGYPDHATPDSRSLIPDSRSLIPDITSASADKTPKYTPEFEAFWTESTKRGSKLEASREWVRINPSPELSEVIHAALRSWKASEQWQDETKQPHLCRWLKRRGWEELVPKPLFGGANGTRQGSSKLAAIANAPTYKPKQ